MQQSENIADLAKALIKAQKEMKPLVKEADNPYFKSKYADLAAVVDACKEALSGNGLAYTQLTNEVEAGVVVVTQLMHESGQWIRGELRMTPVKNDPQGIGSCISYARRYALAAIVGLAPEDDDGEAASGRNVTANNNRPKHDPYLQNVGAPNINTPDQQEGYKDSKKAMAEQIRQMREYAKLTPEQTVKIVGKPYSLRNTLDELTLVYEALQDFVERQTTNTLTNEDMAILMEGKVA